MRSEPAPVTVVRPHGVLVSFTLTILTAFAVLFIAVMSVTLLAMQRENRVAAAEAAESAVTELADGTAGRVQALVGPLRAVLAIAAATVAAPRTDADALSAVATLRDMLAALPQAGAITLAGADGVQVQVLAADPALRARLAMPGTAGWAARVSTPAATRDWLFLDAAGGIAGRGAGTAAPDPRQQTWFRTAEHAAGPAPTVLHKLPSLGRPGLAFVQRLPGGGAIGVALTLEAIGTELAGRRASRAASPS